MKKTPLAIPEKDRRSGAALVLAALSLIVLVPMLGLAIDGSNVYLMRNQINVAMNAAVLAATRSLSVGKTADQQSQAATEIAQTVFSADTSSVHGMSWPSPGPGAPVFSVCDDPSCGSPNHFRTVTGTVTVAVPLSFMGMMGLSSSTITLKVAATKRDVNVVLVLDNGGPMEPTSNTNPILTLQTYATAFVNQFANTRDNVGLITFTSVPYVADPLPNQNFLTNVPNDISQMAAPSTGVPNTAAALSAAYLQLQSLNQPGALNVIVLFTDEIPASYTADFAPWLTAAGKASPTSCAPNQNNNVFGTIWANNRATGKEVFTDNALQSVSGGWQGNDEPETRPAAACSNQSLSPSSVLTQLPPTDSYGNATGGANAYEFVDLAGFTAPQISVRDSVVASIVAASANALDSAATTIRTGAPMLVSPSGVTIQPTIFVIGLLGNTVTALQPDTNLLFKVANDPKQSSTYLPSQPAGQCIIAPSPADLQGAFNSIAGQVLRLAAAH